MSPPLVTPSFAVSVALEAIVLALVVAGLVHTARRRPLPRWMLPVLLIASSALLALGSAHMLRVHGF